MKLIVLNILISTALASINLPSNLPAIPLIVRTPYLSTWITNPSKTLYGAWPTFWNHDVKALSGLIRVDGVAYEFMGNPTGTNIGTKKQVVQNSMTYTATKTLFTLTAGPIRLFVHFLSPIEPNNYKHMSIPASYIYIRVESLDSKTHNVQIYSDITAEWAGGDKSEEVFWTFSNSNSLLTHNVQLTNEKVFQETRDQAEWGTHKFFTRQTNKTTYQSGAADDVRKQFVTKGHLTNTLDKQFRNINDRWPTFGFAKDFGSISSKDKSLDVLFGIAHVRHPAIQYTNASLPSLWTTFFKNDDEMVKYFYDDYPNALSRSSKFDLDLIDKANKAGGKNYATLVQAAVRQAFGGVELVVGATGTPWFMLKEISSDGNCQTADVIYPHFPIQYYYNPNNMKLLLDPLFNQQEAGYYPHKYAMHDLGSSYPRCVGHPKGNDEGMEVEESANMIITTAAYVQIQKDYNYAKQHYKILKQWATYLLQHGLFPGNALTTDDFLGKIKNATNLSLKAIVGIAAMGQLATAAGNKADAEYYNKTANNYIKVWMNYAQDPSKQHTMLGYNLTGTWSMLYNIYPDRLLNTKIIPQSLIDEMNTWYLKVKQKYGIPLEYGQSKNSRTWSKADWSMFQAAIASRNVKEFLINALAKWLNETNSLNPFSDWQDVVSGGSPGFTNRPVIGGLFAPLTLS